jgi:SAM-dependent methyltransferase
MTHGGPDSGPVDYEALWNRWSDMVRYSPAPYHRRRLILSLAERLDFQSVLDVGCGPGETLLALARRFPARLTGVDLSTTVIEANRARFPHMRFAALDVETDALSERFDLVVCSEVLEHCADVGRALDHLRAMTTEHLILTVPSGPVFPIDRAVGHHRHFASAELPGLLRRHRFEPVTVRAWGFPFHSAYKIAINAWPDRMMREFGGGTYSRFQKAVGLAVRSLFYCNLPTRGWQLVVHATAR